jgi:hypothetical protein
MAKAHTLCGGMTEVPHRRLFELFQLSPGGCYHRILAYISLIMALQLPSNALGKVRKHMPFLKELAHEYFT